MFGDSRILLHLAAVSWAWFQFFDMKIMKCLSCAPAGGGIIQASAEGQFYGRCAKNCTMKFWSGYNEVPTPGKRGFIPSPWLLITYKSSIK